MNTLEIEEVRQSKTRPATVLLVGGTAFLSNGLARKYCCVSRCALKDLDAALATQPDIIVAPWIDGRTDCLDVASALTCWDWVGVLMIAAPSLPRPDIIRREVAAHAPLLDVRILSL